MAQLRFFQSGSEFIRLRLDGQVKVVGRDRASSIVLPEADVSRRQFSVKLEGDRWILENLSRFGTSVNGQRHEGRVELEPGAVIELSRWRVEFVANPEASLDDDENGGRRRTLSLPNAFRLSYSSP